MIGLFSVLFISAISLTTQTHAIETESTDCPPAPWALTNTNSAMIQQWCDQLRASAEPMPATTTAVAPGNDGKLQITFLDRTVQEVELPFAVYQTSHVRLLSDGRRAVALSPNGNRILIAELEPTTGVASQQVYRLQGQHKAGKLFIHHRRGGHDDIVVVTVSQQPLQQNSVVTVHHGIIAPESTIYTPRKVINQSKASAIMLKGTDITHWTSRGFTLTIDNDGMQINGQPAEDYTWKFKFNNKHHLVQQ